MGYLSSPPLLESFWRFTQLLLCEFCTQTFYLVPGFLPDLPSNWLHVLFRECGSFVMLVFPPNEAVFSFQALFLSHSLSALSAQVIMSIQIHGFQSGSLFVAPLFMLSTVWSCLSLVVFVIFEPNHYLLFSATGLGLLHFGPSPPPFMTLFGNTVLQTAK